MSSRARQQGAGATFLNVEAQLAVTHNPIFPFASPNIDDRPCSPSGNERTRHPRNPSELYSSSSALKQPTRGPTSRNPYLQAVEGTTKGTPNFRLGIASIDKNKSKGGKVRPGLQVVTDLTHGQPRLGNVTLNQVAAKHPERARNKARSIVSQKGVRILASPLPLTQSPGTYSQSQGFVENVKLDYAERNANEISNFSTADAQRQIPTKSSVVFGSRIPEHKAQFHRHENLRESTTTLETPELTRSTSPTSIYSKGTSYVNRTSGTRSAGLRPQYSHRYASSDPHIKRRLSSESQEEILPDSGDTARPKSQGWWNLVMSPILSRAGTLKVQRPSHDSSTPPVPPVPTDLEKGLPSQTPVMTMSPDTPRRQGLANIRTSTWSRWTDWEEEKLPLDKDQLSPEQNVPAIPHEYLLSTQVNQAPLIHIGDQKVEGLAAEYYHACAVDQLTTTPYFECVNHSCSNHLPMLRSIYDDDKTGFGSKPKSAGDNDKVQGKLSVPTNANLRSVGKSSMSSISIDTGRKITVPGFGAHIPMQGLTSPTESENDAMEIVSPNIRQANVAAFSKAKTVNSREPSPVPPASSTNSSTKQIGIVPINPISNQHIQSPGPISPDAVRSIAPMGAMPLAPIQSLPADKSVPLLAPIPQATHALIHSHQLPSPAFMYPYTYSDVSQHTFVAPPPQQYFIGYPGPAALGEQSSDHRSVASLPPSSSMKTTDREVMDVESSRKLRKQRSKKTVEDKKKNDTRKFGCLCCFGRPNTNKSKKRRWIMGIATILVIIILLCVSLAVLLTRGGRAGPVDSQWLNLTGYPPMPTGISTIAQPNLVASQDQCTGEPLLWSCALPKEDQVGIGSNQPNQPNLRFQIRFQNGTVPASMTIPTSGQVIRQSDDSSFVPNPTPPGRSDQLFLGNTTDNVLQPFDGEATPFFITFMTANVAQSSTANGTKQLSSRQLTVNGTLSSIPPPASDQNGNAAPATLLPTTPFPISQPIKLYNRGLQNEHYGFYMYYDKSIFLSSTNSTDLTNNSAANQNGGSAIQTANLRCTWSQTRFVVKMYTNRAFGASLLAGPTTNSTASQSGAGPTSATNFDRPGSFPYPTTIVIDRHGGNVNKKLIYCYDMKNQQITTSGKLVFEDRSVGGVPINPAPGLLSSTFDPTLGGMDGGTGGCGCTWQNWN